MTSAEPAAQTPTGRCAPLEGKTFASLTQGECGLGPNGVSYCTWHLTFTANDASSTHWEWQHSDYGESGDISCDGTSVGARGTYDASTQHLVWDSVTYAP